MALPSDDLRQPSMYVHDITSVALAIKCIARHVPESERAAIEQALGLDTCTAMEVSAERITGAPVERCRA